MNQLRRQHRWYPEHRTVGILGRRDQTSRPARQRWAHTCDTTAQKSGCVVNVFYFFPTTRPRTKRNKPPSMPANHPTGVVSLPVATKTLHARLHTCRRAVVGGEIGKKNAPPSAPPPPTHAALRLLRRCTMKLKWIVVARYVCLIGPRLHTYYPPTCLGVRVQREIPKAIATNPLKWTLALPSPICNVARRTVIHPI